jgi:hypothetical protein
MCYNDLFGKACDPYSSGSQDYKFSRKVYFLKRKCAPGGLECSRSSKFRQQFLLAVRKPAKNSKLYMLKDAQKPLESTCKKRLENIQNLYKNSK